MTVADIALKLDPFGNRRGVAPDRVTAVAPQAGGLVERVYREYLKIPKFNRFDEESDYILDISLIRDLKVIDPVQIELLLERVIDENPIAKVNDNKMGLFLSALIQNSYTYGHYNYFRLATRESEINKLGWGLKGTKDSKIILAIDGNVGEDCGERAKYIQLDILGNAGAWCGYRAKYTHFDIQGNAGDGCGWGAKHSHFSIHGNADCMCGGNATYTHFNVHNRELFERLKKELPSTSKVALMDDAGIIVEVLQK
jgi:formylmethanofuran dehydrogenase subunit C